MVDIPLQGTPGVLDPRNPTLLPNTDKPIASGAGTLDLVSPSGVLAANVRVASQVTATIAGAVALSDSLTITLTNGLFTGGSLAKTIIAATGDTVSNLAEKFAAAFNDDAQCQALGVEVDATLGVLTFNWPGPVGNITVASRTINIGSETITFSPVGGGFTGGSGPIVPYNNFQATIGGVLMNFRAGIPEFVDPPFLAQLVTEGQPIV